MTRFDFDGAPNRIVGDGLMIVALAVVAGALLWMMIGCTPRRCPVLRPPPSPACTRLTPPPHPRDIWDDVDWARNQADWIDRDCDPERKTP